jgi:hypothetical protein
LIIDIPGKPHSLLVTADLPGGLNTNDIPGKPHSLLVTADLPGGLKMTGQFPA